MDSFETACQLLPTPLRRRMETFTGRHPEEIRLRRLRPPSLVINGRELELPGDRLSENELNQVLERCTAGPCCWRGPPGPPGRRPGPGSSAAP